MSKTLDVVVGGQYGSESKGRVTAAAVQRRESEGRRVIAVRTAGPNAGHVVYDADGNRFALRCIPVAAAVSTEAELFVGPGSEVDLEVLAGEVELLESKGHEVRSRLWISEHATWLEPEHRLMEQPVACDGEQGDDLIARTGSTGKGIGAARSERIWRRALTLGQLGFREELAGLRMGEVADRVRGAQVATIIEGTQGYGLGLHTAAYPQVTSSDCRVVDFLAMAGFDPWNWAAAEVHTHMVVRPNPIRVAGNSGPLKGETTWVELGLPEERTTVTNKVRRVGAWDRELVQAAAVANGSLGRSRFWVAVAMMDHLAPSLYGRPYTAETMDELDVSVPDQVSRVLLFEATIRRLVGRIGYVGTGPHTTTWVGA